MKSALLKATGMTLLMTALGGVLLAVPVGPEIDGATAGNALMLLGGALLLIRGRKR